MSTRGTRPKRIDAALLRKWPLPRLDSEEGKEARGRVLVVGGSTQIPGAVLLAGLGALRAGAGKLQIATAADVATAIAIAAPEARVFALKQTPHGELSPGASAAIAEQVERCNALLLGPGMQDARAVVQLLRKSVSERIRAALVVDAAALTAFDGRTALSRSHEGGVIATPHAGEMAKLWGIPSEAVRAGAVELAREAAAQLRVVLVLKGARTVVAGPDGSVFVNEAGNVGLGTSGSGDVLSGIVAGLCARRAEALQAAVYGVHLHALAGDRLAKRLGPLGYLARELLDEIPPLLAELTKP